MKTARRSLLFYFLSVLFHSTICEAFVGSRQQPSSSSCHHRILSRISSPQTPLHAVAKSGGKMIETEDQYNKAVLSKNIKRPALVLFSAPWCGPCRLTNPVVKEVMEQYVGVIDVYEICTDDLAEISEGAGIMSIPTIQLYYGGKAVDTIVGCVAQTVLANAVEKVLEDISK